MYNDIEVRIEDFIHTTLHVFFFIH